MHHDIRPPSPLHFVFSFILHIVVFLCLCT
nr:MAG TPA: hypothetical protein [Caudoviricetes sp.]